MSKHIDWAALFVLLNKEISVSAISRETGLSRSAIEKYKHEKSVVNPDIDKYVKAMLLFLDKTDRDIPVIGQFFEELVDEETND